MHLAATNSSVSASAANPGSPRAVKQAEQVAETLNQTAIQPANQTPTNHDGCWVNLNAGKPLPGPDEWRALERRASSFRLR